MIRIEDSSSRKQTLAIGEAATVDATFTDEKGQKVETKSVEIVLYLYGREFARLNIDLVKLGKYYISQRSPLGLPVQKLNAGGWKFRAEWNTKAFPEILGRRVYLLKDNTEEPESKGYRQLWTHNNQKANAIKGVIVTLCKS